MVGDVIYIYVNPPPKEKMSARIKCVRWFKEFFCIRSDFYSITTYGIIIN